MKQTYTVLIVAGVVVNLLLFVFYDKSIAAYGPVIFWGIGAYIMLRYGWKSSQLFLSVKRTNPELYKAHTIGRFHLKSGRALRDQAFLDALIPEEQKMAEEARGSLKYMYVCMGLFVVSSFLIVLL